METKISFDAKTFVDALTYANKVMTKNPVVPILENVLLSIDGNTMKVTGSDLQTTINVAIDIKNNGANFKACMPVESLKYLKKVEGEISLSYDHESYSLIFSENDGRAKYSGENFEDFPVISSPSNTLYTLPQGTQNEFKDLLNYVSKDELRPAQTGINFGSYKGKFYLCATDGHTLKTVNISQLDGLQVIEPMNGAQSDFILPSKPAKILADSKINSEIIVQTNLTDEGKTANVSFWFESPIGFVEIITRSIDEIYPQYYNVIPSDSTTQYTFESKLFLKQLDKVELFANKTTHQIRLSLNGVNKISAEDLDFSNEACFVTGGSYLGEGIEIGFNGEFLKKAIKSFGESVTVQMTKPNKCAVIQDEKSLVLVMPVMLNQYA